MTDIYYKQFLCTETYQNFTEGKEYSFHWSGYSQLWDTVDDIGRSVRLSVTREDIWGDVFKEIPIERSLENK
jgi:hypothetical protein